MDDLLIMYTMAVEYNLEDGTLVHAREQSRSSSPKYPIGKELKCFASTIETLYGT